jgi:hypothetical protein
MSREREMQCLEEFINIYQSEFCLLKFTWEYVFLFCNYSLRHILRLFLLFIAISKPTIASVWSSVEAIIKTTAIRLNVCVRTSVYPAAYLQAACAGKTDRPT